MRDQRRGEGAPLWYNDLELESDGVSEGRVKESYFELLKESVVPNARTPETRINTHNDGTERENELTTELGRVERHLYRLRKRREELLEELGHRKRDTATTQRGGS